jgi:electron transfer flavoprotein alpha/beta subunit
VRSFGDQRKAGEGTPVTVIHVRFGSKREPMIRKALAIGADEAVRVNHEILIPTYETAHQIATQVAKDQQV